MTKNISSLLALMSAPYRFAALTDLRGAARIC